MVAWLNNESKNANSIGNETKKTTKIKHAYSKWWWPDCWTNQNPPHHTHIKNRKRKKLHVATNGGLTAEANEKHMHTASKTQKDQKTCTATTRVNNSKNHAHSNKNEKRNRTCNVDEHLSHTPTQLRVARSLARTTRTRNETETSFPIGGELRWLFIPLNVRFNLPVTYP